MNPFNTFAFWGIAIAFGSVFGLDVLNGGEAWSQLMTLVANR